MSPKRSGMTDGMGRFSALLLVLAFALSGWKILGRAPAANFASLPPQVAMPAGIPADAPKVTSANSTQQLSPDGRFRFDAGFVSSAPGQAVHAASLVELRDGRLRAVWFSGSREGAGDVAVRTAVMDAATLRWGAESTLFDRQKTQHGLWRYVKKLGNPVIARAPDGSLGLWMVNVSLGGWAGSAITWSRSTDEGLSWSEPRRLVTSPFLNISTLVKGAPVVYQNGEIGLPVYHEFVTKFAEVLRISSEGQVIDKVRIPGSQTSLQPVLLVAGPEQAQVYMRSGNAQALMASATGDAGKSWSEAAPTTWPNPDSALAGVVSRSGTQWLALNPAPRNRETLALLSASTGGSFDGMQPWIVEKSPTPQARLSTGDYERILSGELRARGASETQTQAYVASAKRQLCGADSCSQEFSYPYLLQSRDGYIHLVYTWHRTRIKHVRFDPLQHVPAAPAVSPHASAPH
ncbi:sialidase family protein [Polaromonas jejuensis]|uniref:Exo-alpha-sialidase n=1 Tax=Polaromonas jejuensis TaxID=457502 RepID=A0ABW0QCX3_9BURK|nr:sialidase family protein [Polaromonas jejuensis]